MSDLERVGPACALFRRHVREGADLVRLRVRVRVRVRCPDAMYESPQPASAFVGVRGGAGVGRSLAVTSVARRGAQGRGLPAS